MTDPRSRRKLAAILSADVVGYSRLMAADEAATVETLKSYRDIIARLVVRRGGRVVNAPGDALLAEFPSAVEAHRPCFNLLTVASSLFPLVPKQHPLRVICRHRRGVGK